MEKYYKDEIKLEAGDRTYTLKDLSLEQELDLDMFSIKFNDIVRGNGEMPIKDLILALDKEFLLEIARWGRANVLELKDTPYLEIAFNMWQIASSFVVYREELKKK